VPERLRIVQVCGSSGGGVGRHVREVAAALAEHHDVVLAGPEAVVEGVVRPVRTVVVDITDRPRPGDQAVVRHLRMIAAGADLVHAHGLRAGALTALAISSLGSRERRPGLVVTLHNLPVGGPRVQAISSVLERLVARRADVVLGVSSDLVERARERGAADAERALVPAPPRREPMPLDAARRREVGLDDDGSRALVLTVARLAPQKGLDLLCDAAALLAADGAGPAVVWAVAGDGPLAPDLEERIEREDLPVRPLGRRDDVPDLLAAADVVVSTSAWEGQPLGVQEALGVGAAVVATDVGGTAEVTGDAAVLVPYGDAQALAGAVRALLADPERRAALQVAARERAATLPTLPDVLAQLEAVYSRVLG
jgi:glycosyltransferase involved in cell wall biosynthesis